MAYKLAESMKLAYEVTRAKSIMQHHLRPDRTYSAQDLIRLCRDLGLDYDLETFKKIGAELVKEGVLEVVS